MQCLFLLLAVLYNEAKQFFPRIVVGVDKWLILLLAVFLYEVKVFTLIGFLLVLGIVKCLGDFTLLPAVLLDEAKQFFPYIGVLLCCVSGKHIINDL